MIHDLVLSSNGLWFYLAIILVLFGSAFGLPIPEDVPLIAAGVALHQLDKSPIAVFLVCYLGIVLSDLLLFQIGRKLGPKLLKRRWFRSKLTASHLHNIRHKVNKNSIWMIFIARHLFYLRSVTFIACGAIGMSRLRFFIIDSAAALVSVPLMIFIGYSGAENFTAIKEIAGNFELWLILPLLVVGFFLLRLKRKTARRKHQIKGSEHGQNSQKAAQSNMTLCSEAIGESPAQE